MCGIKRTKIGYVRGERTQNQKKWLKGLQEEEGGVFKAREPEGSSELAEFL